MPIVTVIIPTLGSSPALDKCLSSLSKQTFSDFDVIVVSNGIAMSERDLTVSCELRSKIRLIVSERNCGYGWACNMGARATNAPFLVFLNDDTYLEDNCLSELYKSMSAQKNAVFQPIIRHVYAGQTRAGNPCDIFGATGLAFYANCGTGDFYASGASLAISKNSFDSLGGFDEKLFLYYDDVDLGWRARLLGIEVSAAGAAFCVHSGGASSRDMPHAQKFYFTQRNRIRVLIKDYSSRRIVARVPLAGCLILAGAFFFAIKARSSAYFRGALKALVWNMIALRDTLACRYVIQRGRIESDSEIEKAMCKDSMDLCVFKRYLA